MGALFRSEEMALCQLFISSEAAYASVSILGEIGIVQFRDLNSNVNPFMRKYVDDVRRFDELERKLRYIEGEVKKDGVPIPEPRDIPRAPNPREIIDLEAQLEKNESQILELSQNAVNLKTNFVELNEMKHVLEKAQVFLSEQEESDSSRALIGGDDRGRLGFVAGVIQRDRVFPFERMLWRISRGNVFVRQTDVDEPLEDPATGKTLNKTVFVAFFQGENLKSRVKKVCGGFHASIYPCPSSAADRAETVKDISTRLKDLETVLNQTSDHRQRALVNVAKELNNWRIMVRKMKAIYHTLNMFNMDVTTKCLIGECWVPVKDLAVVSQALIDGGKAVGSTLGSVVTRIDTMENQPTFIHTNKFTSGFQILIDSYGVTSYREVNPALYTIVTFPFLFAVMFGDLGHGLIVTLFALFMVLGEKKYMAQKGGGEIWRIFFGGRYIILMMGIFSMYTGFIYNDVFSISTNIFGSSWKPNYNLSTIMSNKALQLDPATNAYHQSPYPVGLDPAWQTADNKIIFLNSFKMKLSIIIGIIHMIFGVCLSVVNHIHNRKYANLLLDFFPQLLFLVLLFGYLAILMFAKWLLYYPTLDPKEIASSPTCAPNILITFINMVLMGQNPDSDICDKWMYPYQDLVQKILLFTALICVPFMLAAKPIYIACKRMRPKYSKRATRNGDLHQGVELQCVDDNVDIVHQQAAKTHDDQPGEHDLEDEPMSEILVHQAIHTIEYVLSTVSHTASYLRLWALSLAHAQLSEVLWSMVLRLGIRMGGESYVGGVYIFIIFALWAFFTIAILVLMEGLSAFLHTLRLHWVEFMSKFYVGAGYAFEPFSFKGILDPHVQEED